MPTRYTFTGRLVQGDAHKPQAQRKDDKTGALKFRKDGQPDCPFYLAVAIPKDPAKRFTIPGNPSFEDQRALIEQEARAAWPQFFLQPGQTRNPNLRYPSTIAADCTNPSFANKIIDGDDFDDKGRPYAENDGWGGCWVVKVTNGFAPKTYVWTAQGWQETMHAGVTIKAGDFVTVSGTCETNKSDTSPGMYMNVDTVSFEEAGPPILGSNNVDPNAALGQRGALAGNPGAAPAHGGAPHQPANVGAGSTGVGAASGETSTIASPYDGYMASGATAAPPPPPSYAAPAPPPPQMTSAATTTYAQYIAAGWTDDALRKHGLML